MPERTVGEDDEHLVDAACPVSLRERGVGDGEVSSALPHACDSLLHNKADLDLPFHPLAFHLLTALYVTCSSSHPLLPSRPFLPLRRALCSETKDSRLPHPVRPHSTPSNSTPHSLHHLPSWPSEERRRSPARARRRGRGNERLLMWCMVDDEEMGQVSVEYGK